MAELISDRGNSKAPGVQRAIFNHFLSSLSKVFRSNPMPQKSPRSPGSVPLTERRWGRMLFYKKERGQGMVEYALLIALLAIVVIFMIEVMGTAVSGMYSNIVSAFPIH